jgi:ATP synthase protein I
MSDRQPLGSKPPNQNQQKLIKQVGSKMALKQLAKQKQDAGMWFGLGMMGVIGWSIAVPTLLGVSLGIWLDMHYSHERSWTLALLLAGLAIGCFTAWTWISKEYAAIHNDNRKSDEDDN